jgi:hypothetical protein
MFGAGARIVAGALTLLALGPAHVATAQQTTTAEAPKALLGVWELSNAERDRRCTVTLDAGRAAAGFVLRWANACAQAFPFTRDVAAWRIGVREAMQFVDAEGKPLLEVSEVEAGMYEGERTGEGLLFLQSTAGGAAEPRKPAQMVGDWGFKRTSGAKLCTVTLTETAAPPEAFTLQIKPGCDAAITRFGPTAWRLDRDQLVILRARGEPWRFEESEPLTWRRIPEGRQPLLLVHE